MIRLTWRQFRNQAAAAFAALATLAIVLAITGPHLAHLYDASGIATCKAPSNCDALKSTFLSHDKLLHNLLGPLLLAVPALLGIFWGAPLVARELEAGTYRLAWTQSVTRTRWLGVKVVLLGLASIAVAGLFSLMITWWSSPVDHANMNRFAPGAFDERGIVAIGYAAFAFALGLTAGTLIRRTVPAMATTLVAFVGARLAITYWIRPHLMTPAHTTAGFGAASNLGFEASGPSGVTFVAGPPHIPNAWVYSDRIVDKTGRAATNLHAFLQGLPRHRYNPELDPARNSSPQPRQPGHLPSLHRETLRQIPRNSHLPTRRPLLDIPIVRDGDLPPPSPHPHRHLLLVDPPTRHLTRTPSAP